MESKNYFFVQGEDHRRFRMVIRGDLNKVTVSMIRKFLAPQGITTPFQLFACEGSILLTESMSGKDFNLQTGDVLHLVSTAPSQTPRVEVVEKACMKLGQQVFEDKVGGGSAPRERIEGMATPKNTSRNLESLEQENEKLRAQIQNLQQALLKGKDASASVAQRPMEDDLNSTTLLYQKACQQLTQLGDALGVNNLNFSDDLTCSFGTPDMSLFVTLDPPTERLYLYATLLTALPADFALKSKLYELLLQGSLLSREVCGGGIGLSLESNAVILSTSLPILHCGPHSLAETVPVFVTALTRWRNLLQEFLSI